jgi:hypothetical protein
MGVPRGGKAALAEYLRNMDRIIDSGPHKVYIIQEKRALRDYAKELGVDMLVGDPESIKGGRAKSKGVTEEDVDPKELARGIEEELEHGDDRAKAKKTALDHLAEDPKYYSKLKKVMKKEPELLIYTKGKSKTPLAGTGGNQQKEDGDTREPHGYAGRSKTPKGDWNYDYRKSLGDSDEILVVDF